MQPVSLKFYVHHAVSNVRMAQMLLLKGLDMPTEQYP